MPKPVQICRFLRSRSGNIAISAAITAPLLIAALAVAVDYSALSLQKRHMQTVADLAAVTAAAAPSEAEKRLQLYFQDNGLNYALAKGSLLILPDGSLVARDAATSSADCIVLTKNGNYVADPSRTVGQRFEETEDVGDAVQVTQTCAGTLYFASMLGEPPTLEVTATAAVRKTASFWIGSRLASLNEGILNSVLSATLGTSVSLKAVDYRALVDVDIELLSFIPHLNTQAGLTAATYKDVLDADVRLGAIYAALRKSGQVSASTGTLLKRLEDGLGHTGQTLQLGRVINMDDIGHLPIGSPRAGSARAGLFDIISLSALVSGGEHQLVSGLSLNVPGLARLTLDLAIGEPPVGTPPIAVGVPGSRVRTAQVRLRLNAEVGGVLGLLNTRVNVPIFVEVANAEARLTSIECRVSSNTADSVSIEAVPGVASIAIGTVNENAFINFDDVPRVTKADIVTSPILRISGSAQVDINNIRSRTLTFSASDIRNQRIKSVSTSTPLTSAISSLLTKLDPEISVLGLNIGLTSSSYASALNATLKPLATVLDGILYNTLLAVGVKIGEADVSVTGASCNPPVLVI